MLVGVIEQHRHAGSASDNYHYVPQPKSMHLTGFHIYDVDRFRPQRRQGRTATVLLLTLLLVVIALLELPAAAVAIACAKYTRP